VVDRIPADAGQVVLVSSDELAEAQDAVATIEWASVLLFILVVALFVAAVVLARGWRRVALRNVGVAVLVVGLLLLVIHRLVGNYVVDNFVNVEANRDVAASVWLIATQLLRDIGRNSVAIGVLILLAAALAGPSRSATAVRRFIGPAVTGHPAVLWGGAAVLFLLLVLWAPLPVLETWWGALTAAAILAVAVEALRRRCAQDTAEPLSPGGLQPEAAH
jgi:drug/metabolite transporter (DMT)-like permease